MSLVIYLHTQRLGTNHFMILYIVMHFARIFLAKLTAQCVPSLYCSREMNPVLVGSSIPKIDSMLLSSKSAGKSNVPPLPASSSSRNCPKKVLGSSETNTVKAINDVQGQTHRGFLVAWNRSKTCTIQPFFKLQFHSYFIYILKGSTIIIALELITVIRRK